MRRHVERVRRRRRDRRVPPGRLERVIGERRDVVAVDDVVREPRMLRLASEQALEDCARLQPARIRLVRGLLGRGQRQRVEDRRFRIVRIASRQRCHRVAIRHDTRGLIDCVRARIQLRHGIDEAALAIGFRSHRFRTFDSRESPLKLHRRPDARREWIAPVAQRDPPPGDPAGRVGLQR